MSDEARAGSGTITAAASTAAATVDLQDFIAAHDAVVAQQAPPPIASASGASDVSDLTF